MEANRMKQFFLLILTLLPGMAVAHSGHPASGSLHHLEGLLPLVLVALLVAAAIAYLKNKDSS